MPHMEQDIQKRNRRTNASIDNDILTATKNVIEKVGFANTTLSAIIQEANLEPNTFYRRFDDLDSLFDFFVQKYDYWLGDVTDMQSDRSDHIEYYRKSVVELAKQLYSNKSMQKILIWELSEDNKITRRAARLREEQSRKLLINLQKYFKDTGVDFCAFSALLIGGIYYNILHKDRSTFCGADFSTQEGKKQLISSIDNIINYFFSLASPHNKALEIAKNLKKEQVDNSTIAKATGLPIDLVSSL